MSPDVIQSASAVPHLAAPAKRDGLRNGFIRYGLAVLLVAAALSVTLALEQLVTNTISPLFFLAIMLSAWYGGLGPALLATCLATFSCAYFFLGPRDSLLIGFDDLFRLMVFTITAMLTSSLTAMRRRAEGDLQQARDQLEQRVRDRTAELRTVNRSLQEQIDHARRVEGALRQAEERFRLVVEGVTDYAIFMLDPNACVASWNPGAARISGWSEAGIAGQHYGCFFPADDPRRSDPAGVVGAAAASGRLEDEGWRIRKDGSLFWAEEAVTAVRDEASGALRGFAVVMRDVTERKQLEQAVLEVSERERRRIGHDLHDGLGQQLTGLALRSKMLEHTLSVTSPDDAAEAQRIVELINQTIRQARDMARGLAPVDLDAEGLCAAIRQLSESAQELFGIRCTVDAPDRLEATVPDDAATHLYRIVQEAVSNAVKHGKASEVFVQLVEAGERLELSVSDDGNGFNPATAPRGMGLDLMNYRARMIGGSLEIRSRPDSPTGTVVAFSWLPNRAIVHSTPVGGPHP